MLLSENYKEIIGFWAGVISLIAYAPYIYSIFKGKTKPSRSSWWIWSLVGLVILMSYYSAGARNTIWIPGVFFICPLVVALLSIKYGANSSLDLLDKASITISVASLFVWYILGVPATTLFVNILIDSLGYLSTFKKTWKDSLSENGLTWILFFLGSVLNLVALENYSFPIMLYPVYMFMMDIIMIFLIFIKPPNLKYRDVGYIF